MKAQMIAIERLSLTTALLLSALVMMAGLPAEGTFYRPFIEEGKVWRTGILSSSSSIFCDFIYEYHFMGDTIIDHQKCKKLMRSKMGVSANNDLYLTRRDTVYAAALYETGKRVYGALPGCSHLELLYDFASPIGSQVTVGDDVFTIVRRDKSNDTAFKGECTYIKSETSDTEVCWLEGVGITSYSDEILFSCSVGDGTIYLRDEEVQPEYDYDDGYIDEVIPNLYNKTDTTSHTKRKKRLDFTYIRKLRPKAPQNGQWVSQPELVDNASIDDDEPDSNDVILLTGNYSDRELVLYMKPLSGAYTISIMNEAGMLIYRKELNADYLVAYNINLTAYAHGNYIMIVENATESYTTTFTLSIDNWTAVDDIPSDPIVNRQSLNSQCFDLSGHLISHSPFLKGQASKLECDTRHLPRGIYIVNGRKVLKNE